MKISKSELFDEFESRLSAGLDPTISEMDRLYGPIDQDTKEEMAVIKMLYLSKDSFKYPDEFKLRDKKFELFRVAEAEYLTNWWHPIRKLGLLFRIMDILDDITKLELAIKNINK